MTIYIKSGWNYNHTFISACLCLYPFVCLCLSLSVNIYVCLYLSLSVSIFLSPFLLRSFPFSNLFTFIPSPAINWFLAGRLCPSTSHQHGKGKLDASNIVGEKRPKLGLPSFWPICLFALFSHLLHPSSFYSSFRFLAVFWLSERKYIGEMVHHKTNWTRLWGINGMVFII